MVPYFLSLTRIKHKGEKMVKKQKTKLDPITLLFLVMSVAMMGAGAWCRAMNLPSALDLLTCASLLLGLSALNLAKTNLDKLNKLQ